MQRPTTWLSTSLYLWLPPNNMQPVKGSTEKKHWTGSSFLSITNHFTNLIQFTTWQPVVDVLWILWNQCLSIISKSILFIVQCFVFYSSMTQVTGLSLVRCSISNHRILILLGSKCRSSIVAWFSAKLRGSFWPEMNENSPINIRIKSCKVAENFPW